MHGLVIGKLHIHLLAPARTLQQQQVARVFGKGRYIYTIDVFIIRTVVHTAVNYPVYVPFPAI